VNKNNTKKLLSDVNEVQRIFEHIDNSTTDKGDKTWKEPVEKYRSKERLNAELKVLQHRGVVFCPSGAFAKPSDYVRRDVAGIPLIAVRGLDGKIRAFKNACRHRSVPKIFTSYSGAFLRPTTYRCQQTTRSIGSFLARSHFCAVDCSVVICLCAALLPVAMICS
jgi:hypothetical protein